MFLLFYNITKVQLYGQTRPQGIRFLYHHMLLSTLYSITIALVGNLCIFHTILKYNLYEKVCEWAAYSVNDIDSQQQMTHKSVLYLLTFLLFWWRVSAAHWSNAMSRVVNVLKGSWLCMRQKRNYDKHLICTKRIFNRSSAKSVTTCGSGLVIGLKVCVIAIKMSNLDSRMLTRKTTSADICASWWT